MSIVISSFDSKLQRTSKTYLGGAINIIYNITLELCELARDLIEKFRNTLLIYDRINTGTRRKFKYVYNLSKNIRQREEIRFNTLTIEVKQCYSSRTILQKFSLH